MNPSIKCEFLALVLISVVSMLIADPQKYLISRDDVHEVLSQIIVPTDRIALLSDFDGTLSIIDPNPNMTKITPEAKAALEQIVTRPTIFTSIISGRRVYDVKQRTGIDNITYSGNHGMEILFANKTDFHYPISKEIFANCSKLRNVIANAYVKAFGGWVEDKNISLVYHYGDVPEHLKQKAIDAVTKSVLEYGYRPVPSHSAIEIKPPVVWSKGHAALLILDETYGIGWEKAVRVFYLGDDTSDEDVMRMLQGRATTFRITDNPDLETFATYKLQSVRTATFVLEWLVKNIV